MAGWTFSSGLRSTVSSRTLIIALSAPLAVAAPISCAHAGGALPGTGQYVAGAGSIGKTGTTGLTINQSTNTGIINWNSFSIGKGNSVQFNNGSGATLNRVTGGDLSTIAGSLKGTGSVYLINPQGVIVTNTGKVLTGGTFVGSTRDESDDDFTNGKRHFTGTSNGNVVNQGHIVSSNGDVALIGNAVNNDGSVSAKNGTASLSAGNDVLLAPAGSNGRIMVSGGTGDATNSGTISAAQAQLNAAGGNVYALGGNNGGIIRATGTQTLGGHVWLTSANGDVSAGGNISAKNVDGSGGTIEATGNNLAVTADANISAGGTKGGTILLGGDVHGGAIAADNFAKDKIVTAQTTTVANGAKISADASNGAGGNVVIWSDIHTDYDGAISAKGAAGSQGGFAEVSSHDLLGFTGTVDLTAANGQTGTLLLDPENVVISSKDGTTTDTLSGGSFTPSGDDSIIYTGNIETNLGSTNIVVNTGATGTQQGNISVIDPITWGFNTLTLDAFHSITIGAPMTITSGEGNLVLATNDGGTNGTLNIINGSGRISFSNLSSLLNINGNNYALVNSLPTLISDIATTPGGFYALASNITAPTTAYTSAPIPTTFTGTFEGLGNSIVNLKINDSGDLAAGLFANIDTVGVVRDLDLVNPSVISSAADASVGALAATSHGAVFSVRAIGGSVAGGAGGTQFTGGLIGNNFGQVDSSSTTDAVSAGDNANAGGIAGKSNGTIAHSYSASVVSATTNNAFAGGLVGYNLGVIASSYATGSATTTANGWVGGLAGYSSGIINYSYATGKATSGATSEVGGLVGNDVGSISYSYALGAAVGGTGAGVGGLVGTLNSAGSINQAYSTGAVSGGASSNLGGVAGSSSGTITNVYYATDTSGRGSTGVGSGTSSGITGLLRSAMTTASNMPGLTFGTTPGSPGFVIADLDSTFNNQSAAIGATLPLLLQELNDGSDVHIINNAHQLQLMGLDEGGTYFVGSGFSAAATGTNADVWQSTSGFAPIAESLGNLFGLNHAIGNLFINNSVTYAAVIGENLGRIEDVVLTYASVSGASSGSQDVAALVGYNDGFVIGSSASGQVRSTGNGHNYAGGLVSFNSGTMLFDSSSVTVISTGTGGGYAGGLLGENNSGTVGASFATGHVSGGVSTDDGGLVGYNANEISESYALGNVTGGVSANVGGVVGLNGLSGTIGQTYATGVVTGGSGSHVAGLIGNNSNTNVNAIQGGYFDTQTSGLSVGVGAGNATGVIGNTTAQLQTTLNFDPADWALVAGKSYPYLQWQVPTGTPQIVSGTIGGGASNAGLDVDLQVGGKLVTALNAMPSGANGYYYELLAPGTIASTGSKVLAFVHDGTVKANALEVLGGSISGFNLFNGYMIGIENAATLSGVEADYTSALGTSSGSDFLGFTHSLEIIDNAATFAFNTPLTLTGSLILKAGGAVTQTGAITAAALTGSANGLTLNGANKIASLGAFTSGGNFSLTDATSLNVSGALNVIGCCASLTTTGAGHNLAINAAVSDTGHTIALTSAGTIAEGGSGKLTAAILQGSSVGGVTLNGANQVDELGAFTNTGGGNIALTNAEALYVSGGNVNAGTGNVTLKTTGAGNALNIGNSVITGTTVTLTSAGTMNETGAIHATTLQGSSVGGTTLNGANLIGAFDSFTNTGGGNIALTDAQALYVGGGGVNAGTGNVTLKTTGAGHNIGLGNVVTGTTVSLLSAGTISEGGSGVVHATTLLGSSVGGATLNDANLIGAFDSFTNTGGGNIALTDAQALYIGGGGVNAGSGNVTLVTTGAGHNLSIGSALSGATVTLTTASEAVESSAGTITATSTLNVSAGTGIDLNSTHNHIHAVGTRHTNSGPNVIAGIGM